MADISSLTTIQNNHEKYKHLFDKGKSTDIVNTDTFFSLLMAEMTNQDPLEPMSNTEFVSQMAQFTALSAQQENLKYSMTGYASNLIGKELTLNAKDEKGELLHGICSDVTLSGSTVKVKVDGNQYELSQIKGITDKAPNKAETSIDTAMQYLGKKVIVKATDEDGEIYYDGGIVDSVESTDGNAKIVVNNYVYEISDIIQVEDPAITGNGTALSGDDADLQKLLEIIGQ